TRYQSRLWIAAEAAPQLPSSLIGSLQAALAARVVATWGGVMQMGTGMAPARLRCSLLNDFENLTAEAITSATEAKELDADKIYLAVIHWKAARYLIEV